MYAYTVAFFGHRRIENLTFIEELLHKHLKNIILHHEYVNFLIGRNGDFDQAVSSVTRKLKVSVRSDNNALTLVLPYPTNEFIQNQQAFENYYDEIEICPESSTTHFKKAITVRNQTMIDRADLVIVYCHQLSGGAYQALRYAQKQNKTVINLYEEEKSIP